MTLIHTKSKIIHTNLVVQGESMKHMLILLHLVILGSSIGSTMSTMVAQQIIHNSTKVFTFTFYNNLYKFNTMWSTLYSYYLK